MSPSSVRAFLFREGCDDGLLRLGTFSVAGEPTEDWLGQTGDVFAKVADVVGLESRSILSTDALIMLMCSASERGGFMAVCCDDVSSGLLAPVSFDPGLSSLGRAKFSTGLPTPILDTACVIVPDLEDSSAGLLISEATCLEIAIAEASSSAGPTISAVCKYDLTPKFPCSSSGLMAIAMDECG